MSVLIRGGRVITAADDYVGDVFVENDRLLGETEQISYRTGAKDTFTAERTGVAAMARSRTINPVTKSQSPADAGRSSRACNSSSAKFISSTSRF